jgi:hypothetical protein
MRRSCQWVVLVLGVVGMLQLACNLSGGGVDEQTAVAATLTAIASQAPPQAASDTPLPASETPPPPSETVTATASLTLTPTGTSTITLTPQPCDAAAFVKDVTYPDGAEVFGGAAFTKTWRLKNVGTCTWTSGYKLIFDSGDRMSAPDSVTLTGGTVPPGAAVDVSVDLKAPSEEGTYQGYFKIRNPSGVVFGIGPAASGAFWVKIKAVKLILLLPTLQIFPIVTLGP